MKKSVKTLIILNLLTYINNFLFSFTYTYANETLRKNWLFFGIWFLSPYVLGSLSVFICLEPTKHVFNTLFSKLMALIVTVVIFLWFQQTNYKKCNLFYLNKELAKRIFIYFLSVCSIGYRHCYGICDIIC